MEGSQMFHLLPYTEFGYIIGDISKMMVHTNHTLRMDSTGLKVLVSIFYKKLSYGWGIII